MSCTCPRPPVPYVTQPNPAFEQWVERHAIELCADADPAHADARPCMNHLRQARKVGLVRAWNRVVVAS